MSPSEWHTFDIIGKYLLYQTECIYMSKFNYINECKKYNQNAKPISFPDLDHFKSVQELITQNTINECYVHNNETFYGFGGEFLHNNSFVWYNKNNIYNSPVIDMILSINDNITGKYIGIPYPSLNINNIELHSSVNFGIICELNINNIENDDILDENVITIPKDIILIIGVSLVMGFIMIVCMTILLVKRWSIYKRGIETQNDIKPKYSICAKSGVYFIIQVWYQI